MLSFIQFMDTINTFYWEYVGTSLLMAFGLYMTFRTKGFQFKLFGKSFHEIKNYLRDKDHLVAGGISPIKLYFASVGGSIGIGNIVNVTAGFAIGGPGVLFWLWVSSFLGMMVKYCEVFLGIKYREANSDGGFNGGFMYVLRRAFNSVPLAALGAIFMCIYGCEVYQFSVVSEIIYNTYPIDKMVVVIGLLLITMYCAIGGVQRLANICSLIMPGFLVVYIILCFYVIGYNYAKIPEMFITVFKSAFTGHAMLGGFIGSTFLMGVKEGVSRAVYAGDIGVGYDSIIQAETAIENPAIHARFSMFGMFSSILICTLSIMVVLASGIWCTDCPRNFLVRNTFMEYFPYAKHFMASLLFLAGFTTIIGYLTVGYKSAAFVSKKWGKLAYTFYAIPALVVFSYFDSTVPQLVMTFCSGILMFLNLIAIWKLRKEIRF